MSPPSSTEVDATEALVDLLGGFADADFNAGGAPEYVEAYHEESSQQRLNREGVALYVWQPSDADLSELSADGDWLDAMPTPDIEVWALNKTDAIAYARDVVRLLQTNYARDNQKNTEFHHIQPTSYDDARAETAVRRSDFYVVTVTTDTRRVNIT